jgi:diaminopimelate epimerase
MVYYNSDGNQSTMCGNGGDVWWLFTRKLKVIDTKAVFNAVDGLLHQLAKMK